MTPDRLIDKMREKELTMQDIVSKDYFNAADYFLDRNIRQGRGHKIAIYSEYRNYTYNDIQKMTNKTAHGLIKIGVRIEDRVMLLILDIPAFYSVFWGTIKIGAIPIPINTMLTADDYEFYLNDSRARLEHAQLVWSHGAGDQNRAEHLSKHASSKLIGNRHPPIEHRCIVQLARFLE